MEKMEKRLNLWIQPIKPMKKVWQTALLRLKVKSLPSCHPGSEKREEALLCSTGWVARFKRPYGVNNVKLAAEASSADQKAAEEFKRCLLNVIQEKGYVEEPFFNAGETGVFYKNVGKRTYVMWMTSNAPGFKSFQDYATLLTCTSAKGDSKCKPLAVYRPSSSQALNWKNVNHIRCIGGGTKKGGKRLIGSTAESY